MAHSIQERKPAHLMDKKQQGGRERPGTYYLPTKSFLPKLPVHPKMLSEVRTKISDSWEPRQFG